MFIFATIPAVRTLGYSAYSVLVSPWLLCQQQACLSQAELPARTYSHLDLGSTGIFLLVFESFPAPIIAISGVMFFLNIQS